MIGFKLALKDKNLQLFEEAVRNLGSQVARKMFAMGLNKTNAKVYTVVKRVVAKQMGTTQANVVKHGGLKKVPASASNMQAMINSYGGYMPTKDFRPKMMKEGVVASPWGDRELFAGAFINRGRIAKRGIGPIGKAAAGGHVFVRTNKRNEKSKRDNAIRVHWGPSVPVELVRRESEAAFEKTAAEQMNAELGRAYQALMKGFVK